MPVVISSHRSRCPASHKVAACMRARPSPRSRNWGQGSLRRGPMNSLRRRCRPDTLALPGRLRCSSRRRPRVGLRRWSRPRVGLRQGSRAPYAAAGVCCRLPSGWRIEFLRGWKRPRPLLDWPIAQRPGPVRLARRIWARSRHGRTNSSRLSGAGRPVGKRVRGAWNSTSSL